MPTCSATTPALGCSEGRRSWQTQLLLLWPLKPDFRAIVRKGKAKVADPTASLRQKRRRAKLKGAAASPVTVPIVTVEPREKPNDIKPNVTVRHGERHGSDMLAYIVAVALAGAAAWFSIKGMVKLFPGDPVSVICMAVAMESAKLVTAGFVSRCWRATAWVWRLVLVVLVAGLAVINAAGVYAQLVAAHVGERGAAPAAVQAQGADVDAKIEVAAGRVADLDRQIAQIDAAVAAATQRGKTQAALAAMDSQRKARAGLAGERDNAAGALSPFSSPNALTWLRKAMSRRRRRRLSCTWPKCSALAVTRSGRSGG
jgi:hypothetical protein